MCAGLSSLEALKQKLAQDQARLAGGGGTKPYRPAAPSAGPPEDCRGTLSPPLAQVAPQPLLGAVSYLRACSVVESEDGRCSAADVDREASAIARKAVEAAQPAPPGAEGGGVDFESDPINFTHILRFMRDGEAWQPPDDDKARAALKKEAVYFGCTGILHRLDRDENVDNLTDLLLKEALEGVPPELRCTIGKQGKGVYTFGTSGKEVTLHTMNGRLFVYRINEVVRHMPIQQLLTEEGLIPAPGAAPAFAAIAAAPTAGAPAPAAAPEAAESGTAPAAAV
ncbi:unnamed protein product, partial [Prorocentrum cordatum]